MVISRRARLAYYASVLALLAMAWLGPQHAHSPRPVRVGTALKITR